MLFAILTLGAILGWFCRQVNTLVSINRQLTPISIWALLAVMGAKLAQHRSLFTSDLKILLLAIGSSAALTIVFFLVFWVARAVQKICNKKRETLSFPKTPPNKSAGSGRGLREIYSVAISGGCIITGFLLFGLLPETYLDFFSTNKITDWLLRAMLFLIGFDLGTELHRLDLRLITPKMLLVPFINIALSLAFGLLFGLLSGIGTRNGSLLTAGMGWYSLSSVLLADRGMMMLSLLAFIHNVFRELFAILCAPIAAQVSPILPIYLGGATSMDVMLPFVQRYCGKENTLVSFYSGVVCSIAVLPLIKIIAV